MAPRALGQEKVFSNSDPVKWSNSNELEEGGSGSSPSLLITSLREVYTGVSLISLFLPRLAVFLIRGPPRRQVYL